MKIAVTVTLDTPGPEVSPAALAKRAAESVKSSLPSYYTGAQWHVDDTSTRPRRLRLTDKGERWMLTAMGVGHAALIFTTILAAVGFVGWIQGR